MRNVKTDRGFYHPRTGELLCPVGYDWNNPEIREGLRTGTLVVAGEEWPVFLYKDYTYIRGRIWEGLFRSTLLVYVRFALSSSPTFSRTDLITDSERFYSSVIEAFYDKREKANVEALLAWWDM
ncbi:hypothetical protein BKA70DRAFT_1378314 [Coprinopsis sp. MPI-PUGE-AT-0042]|nr:hypothetical protein BKA70DRAFT_1378314 [Coprinopsis sp. MPI-PUGE-AT-0042]